MELDVERIKQARARAEDELRSILVKLEAETGLSVVAVSVHRADVTLVGDEVYRTAVTGVSVSLDLGLN